ncbi:MAG: nitrogenase [Cyanobacteria bacterium]|nr:nitrogenase [Cyanobacteriota bacterium]MDW8201116.1 Mo-dependent nitrogenase C-terminal domain-containing protein [Cyanobacteriota bacterium SKYGB_h_bin112]
MPTITSPLPPTSGLLDPIRRWINRYEIRSVRTAHLICQVIPRSCPFEHRFSIGKYSLYIPPLCELNPFYNEFVALRFRALNYLEACGETIDKYVC